MSTTKTKSPTGKKQRPLEKVKRTSRGFELIEFVDYYEMRCDLQASSLAEYEQPGTTAVWLGPEDNRMHLHRDQVESLIGHLQAWLKYGTFKLR